MGITMSTTQVNMHEAKSQLSQLGEKAWNGEIVVIAKAGKPYLDLLPHTRSNKPRVPGRYKGNIKMANDLDATPQEIIEAFEGKA